MNESAWLACSNPLAMLKSLSGQASDRKLRLFACACCRRIWERFPDPCNRDLVAVVEENPDGHFHGLDIEAAIVASSAREGEFGDQPAYWVAKYLGRGFYKMTAAESAFAVAFKVACVVDGPGAFRHTDADARPAPVRTEAETLAALLRDIFGVLPFRTPRLDPRWRTPLVVSLARAAYEERVAPDPSRPGWLVLDPARLMVLGDALEEAGADTELLGHLRRPGDHVRGCWCVDLILERP